MVESPKVSIIIRTLNEATFLPSLFDLINNQSYKNYEIIVVDPGSTDETQKIAKEFSDKLLLIEKDDFTFGYAINHGIKHSNGELVCIVSAHTKPNSNNWLEELVSAFNYEQLGNSKVAMSYGKQIGGENSNFSEIMDFNYLFGKKELKKSSPKYFCNNANSMIRKDLWLNHPFNETLSGLEDIEWSKYWMDKGYKIVYLVDKENSKPPELSDIKNQVISEFKKRRDDQSLRNYLEDLKSWYDISRNLDV